MKFISIFFPVSVSIFDLSKIRINERNRKLVFIFYCEWEYLRFIKDTNNNSVKKM